MKFHVASNPFHDVLNTNPSGSLDPRVALDAARNADSTKRVNRY